jgi:DNA-binding response OmpR family regulator
VLLDVMLPGKSGFDVCRELRAARPAQAILMLTARGAEADVLEGFRCGADDYLTKPFSVAELVARVEALLARPARSTADPSPFAFGAWRSIPRRARPRATARPSRSRRARWRFWRSSRAERGRIVSRRRLLDRSLGPPACRRHRDAHGRRPHREARKKIGAGEREPIETVRGEGYRFVG